jgi:threonine dehydratase
MVGVTGKTIFHTWERIKNEIRYTPLFHASHPVETPTATCDFYFKLELHQLTGSFKIRGVTSKILSANPVTLQNGLYAASGGNHGRAVAYAGWKRKIKTTVVLPTTTPQEKINLIQRWQAETIIAGADLDEANEIAKDKANHEHALFIHPFADEHVICGQGTIAVELMEQLPDVDTVIMAVGGGGLISGVGTYLKSVRPDIRVIGVEPAGCPSMYDSLKAGRIVSVARIQTTVGTLAIRQTSELNFGLDQACVDEMVLVTDEQMLAAAQRLWREYGIAAERSGAASFAGLFSGQIKVEPHEKVCLLICGMGTDGISRGGAA